MVLDQDSSPSTATLVTVGESIGGELAAGTIDYFCVTVSSAGRLIASTTGFTATYGSIEDSSGNVLGMDNDSGGGDNFRVWAAVEPGTYFIRVRGDDDSGIGPYTLALMMIMRRLTDHWDRRLASLVVTGWPPHRLGVRPRQQLGYLRDGA